MEERVDDTGGSDVDEDRRCAAVVRHRGPKATATTASDVCRRSSLADFTDLRRRDTAAANQFKGLVIPSPAAGSDDGAKSSMRCLPTIAGTKPQSKLLLTSSTQERPGSSGYQSVLTGLRFISASRSNAPTTASSAQRRSSLYEYPVQHSSGSSSSRSLTEPSGIAQPVNIISVRRDDDGGANELDSTQHDIYKITSRPLANMDSVGGSDEVPTLPPGTGSHSRDEGLHDGGRLLSGSGVGSDNDSSSTQYRASSAARERDVSQATSSAESVKVNNLKADKQHGERPDDNADVEQVTRCCRSDMVDVDRCALPTSTTDASTGSELTVPECQSESLDESVVSPIMALQIQSKSVNNSCLRSAANCRDTTADTGRSEAAGPAVGVGRGDWESSSSTSSGRQRSHVKFNGDAVETAMTSIPRPDNENLTDVVFNKGNLGLGFCISGGRGSTSGYSPIVVKRIFKGSFYVIDTKVCAIGTIANSSETNRCPYRWTAFSDLDRFSDLLCSLVCFIFLSLFLFSF